MIGTLLEQLAQVGPLAWAAIAAAGLAIVWLVARRRYVAGFQAARLLASRELAVGEERQRLLSQRHEHEREQLQADVEQLRLRHEDEARERQRQALLATELRTLLEQSQANVTSREQAIGELASGLREDFASLAGRVLGNQSDQLLERSGAHIDALLGPYRVELAALRKRIDQVHEAEAAARGDLLADVRSLSRVSQQMNDETARLTRALRGDRRVQGRWGEVVLERLLEQSGLRPGEEFSAQAVHRDASGRTQRPDVIVHLPAQRDLIVDAKVSLGDYDRALQAQSAADQAQGIKGFARQLRAHARELGGRDYDALDGVRTLDFVLLFVPQEAALGAAADADPELLEFALSKRVLIVGPTTLLLSLKIVHHLWREARVQRHAVDIADRAGAIYERVRLLLEDVERMRALAAELGGAIDRAGAHLGEGRGNLVRQVESLRELGARVRRPVPQAARELAEQD
ncbi:MAG: DNA recombination protein RmuC [Pseudomonadota bacterium]